MFLVNYIIETKKMLIMSKKKKIVQENQISGKVEIFVFYERDE